MANDWNTAMTGNALIERGFETNAMVMEPHWLVSFLAPSEDVDRIFERITKVAPLRHGKTDRNAYRAPGGMEYYRPLEGTPTGAEEAVRKRPGVDEVRLVIPRDDAVAAKVIEAIYQVHSYYEPVIYLQEVLRSRCKGLDDSDNPHRWWNTTGDWKAGPANVGQPNVEQADFEQTDVE